MHLESAGSVDRRSAVVLLSGLLCLLVLCFAATRLRYPTSSSAPRGLYLLTSAEPTQGGWVVACLPEHLARMGRRRDYLGPGDCPAESSAVLKRVAALPGDTVQLDAHGLSVNGKRLVTAGRRLSDQQGRAVPAIPFGTYRVAPGEVWLYSHHHPSSWDSRYYGAVPLVGVRSSACRLWPSPECAICTAVGLSLIHLGSS